MSAKPRLTGRLAGHGSGRPRSDGASVAGDRALGYALAESPSNLPVAKNAAAADAHCQRAWRLWLQLLLCRSRGAGDGRISGWIRRCPAGCPINWTNSWPDGWRERGDWPAFSLSACALAARRSGWPLLADGASRGCGQSNLVWASRLRCCWRRARIEAGGGQVLRLGPRRSRQAPPQWVGWAWGASAADLASDRHTGRIRAWERRHHAMDWLAVVPEQRRRHLARASRPADGLRAACAGSGRPTAGAA